MTKILQIALPININRLFSYSLPDELTEEDLTGRRALVTLGRRTLTGVIVSESDEIPEMKVKPILELLDDAPVFSDKMLKLTKWISEYYLASWGDTLKAALPQGMSPKSMLHVHILRNPDDEEIRELSHRAPKRFELLQVLKDRHESISVKYLEKQLKSESVALQLEALEKQNIIRCERIVEKEIQPRTQKALMIAGYLYEDEEELKDVLNELDKVSPKQSLLLSHLYLKRMNTGKPVILTDAIRDIKTTRNVADALVKKGYVITTEAEIDRNQIRKTGASLANKNEAELALTEEQELCVKSVRKSIDEGSSKPMLLYGVTGSGKTLVYIHSISYALAQGKTALVLVPEISLTPQLIDRFKTVFGNKVAALHSRMSEGERYDAWRSILQGKASLVIGARSAIFSPLDNIGLIIVDEEHETSYKQESPSPRYNARDAAIVRATYSKAAIVLGSATPSMESMYNAGTGKYELLTILKRADGAKLPDIEIVNMADEKKRKKQEGSFSKKLLELIADRIHKKEGIILFQNRRGFSTWLECPDCRHIPSCKYCDVTLTYHKAKGQLRCHYCGYTINAHHDCPECGYPDMKEVGTGTQKIETELKEYLDSKGLSAEIERMDLDTTSRRGAHRRMLYNFANGYTDILIGTQMVAKGLDFERCTLVGVINADLQLFLPNFRASEKTFQLLTQVAGRAGRSSDLPGKVIIQSSHPENYAITTAVDGDYNSFYNMEHTNRNNAFYPPFYRFTKIEFTGKNEVKVDEQAKYFSSLFPHNQGFLKILGPVIPAVSMIRSQHRRIIILKNDKEQDHSGKKMRYVLEKVLEIFEKKYKKGSVRMSIDIDSHSGI